MRKIKVLLVFTLFAFCDSLFAQIVSDSEKKFIKGSISDKIAIVSTAGSDNAFLMGTKGIDYVLDNVGSLGTDSEMATLATASVLAISRYDKIENVGEVVTSDLSRKLIRVFQIFEDETVKINTLEALSRLKNPRWNGIVDMLNNYLEKRYHDMYPSTLLTGNVIAALGNFGDSKSYSILFNIWSTNFWPEYASVTSTSFMKLSAKMLDETIKMLFLSENSIISRFLDLMKKSPEITQDFSANVAENALLFAINNAEKLQEYSTVFVNIQIDCLRILKQTKWSHSEEVILKNFAIARKEHSLGLISDEEFVEMLNNSASFRSTKISQVFSNLLAEFNSNAEHEAFPADKVILSVIKNLGELGDKVAFDNLLYVTYLSYPERIVDAAKDSLSKLKW